MSSNDPRVPQAIMGVTSDPRIREAMLVGSYLETTWDPSSVGDHGTSFGPFQMHIGGELTAQGGTPSEAQDPVWAAQHMLSAYTRGVAKVPASLWTSNPEQAAEQAAVFAEVPAQDYYTTQGQSRVDEAWAATQKALGGSTGNSGSGLLSGLPVPGILGSTDILSSLLSLFGLGSIKDLAERAGLIIFGAILILVGLVVATKKEDKAKEIIKEKLSNGDEVTETKETKTPRKSEGLNKGGPINPEASTGEAATGGLASEAEVAAVAV